MNRNYSIDFLKAFMAIGIIMIHTGTYIIGKDNLSTSGAYIYSLCSLFVPTFFIISGFFYARSNNKEKAIVKIVLQYLIYVILSIILNIIILDMVYEPNSIDILKLTSSINHFWFVNSLIYYMLFFYVVNKIAMKKFDLFFLCAVLILFVNLAYVISTHHFRVNAVLEIIFFAMGYFISRFNIKLSSKFILLIPIYPIFVHFQYEAINIFTMIFSMILFLSISSASIKKSKFTDIAKDSLKILFIHYYITELLINADIVSLTGYHMIINFTIVAFLTLVTLFIFNYSTSYITKIYNKVVSYSY